MIDETELITVTQLKQYTYCPRVVYFEACTPGIRPITHLMEAGVEAHEAERERASRRSMYAYQLPEGRRELAVRLRSVSLGLTGIVDEVITTPDEVIVVDHKMASWAGANHVVQIAAYGLLAAEHFLRPSRRGFVYLMAEKHFEEVAFPTSVRNSALEAITAVRHIVQTEYMPPPNRKRSRCLVCEFQRFCNDV